MLKTLTSVLASAALVVSTTAMAAVTPQTNAPSSQPAASQALAKQRASDPWFMLSVMSPTQSIALGDANTAAALSQLPAPGVADYVGAAPVVSGEVIGVGVWFALIVVALSIQGSAGGGAPNAGQPNSPA